MILIFSNNISARLQYICSFIFKDRMNVDFSITTSEEELNTFEGLKIVYSNSTADQSAFIIQPHTLLFEKNITEQKIEVFEAAGRPAFFKIFNSDIPFDIFAATFYLLSRYEEYLLHKKDMYGRFSHENSIAFKNNFLHLPLINIWLTEFAGKISEKYPAHKIQLPTFEYIPTYDIDIAYSYKDKGFLRNIGGFIKSPGLERTKVLLGLQDDPFDSYLFLDDLHDQYNLNPIYFFLLAEKNSEYDKNILPEKKSLIDLIRKLSKKYSIGIHPSWQSGDDHSLIKKEIETLKKISDKKITSSRQHYIRFNLPDGYRRLISEGITDDHSMGYGSINGFRASVASSFYWYDLKNEEQTLLRVHPFCFMEANSLYEQKQSAEQTLSELQQYYSVCKENNGTLITVWHNHFLGTDKLYAGWSKMYKAFLKKNFR